MQPLDATHVAAHFELIDSVDALDLNRDIQAAIGACVNGGYTRLWIFTNNYPHVIELARRQLDFRAVARLGITDLQVTNCRATRLKQERLAAKSLIPTLLVEQFNQRQGLR
jgi:hypothetical protein